jgi:indole-3-glycerol phosphate synthase
MILSNIIEEKKKEIERAKKKTSQKDLLEQLHNRQFHSKPHFFKHSLAKHNHIHLIAEIKKASPSAGVLREDFDPLKIARFRY